MATVNDTICAVATPAGRGGVSIVRVSGPASFALAARITGSEPAPGRVRLCRFTDCTGRLIDQGLLLGFRGPSSFTGEDVCEFHTHGSPVVTDLMLEALVSMGARLARPGEFSERAFLNDRMDLAQAEAIADLINSASASAARYSLRSLQGEFSKLIQSLVERLTLLRIYIEAALDFPEEEVDFLGEGAVAEKLDALLKDVVAVQRQARQGALVREGIKVAIAGEPNAGKSTLLNTLAGSDTAIVTDIPGTTRDILRQELNLDGLPIHVLDTAGLRSSDDPVEQEGIRRAWAAIREADVVLLVLDARLLDDLARSEVFSALTEEPGQRDKLLMVINKIDLTGLAPGPTRIHDLPALAISAREQLGIAPLRERLKRAAGFHDSEEGGFIARRRHLDALLRARTALEDAVQQMHGPRAGELVAEDLRRAQDALGEITGQVSSDDLLGRIFSSFCIGK